MRKSRAETIVIQHEVEKEAEFSCRYPHLASELRDKAQDIQLAEVAQVSFLSRAIDPKTPAKLLRDSIVDEEIFATCVIVSYFPKLDDQVLDSSSGFLYEAIVRTPVPVSLDAGVEFPPNYTHVQSKFSIIVLGKEHELPGSYFVQQNGIDCVCAQACIKMSLIHVDGFSDKREPPTAHRINEIVREQRVKNEEPALPPLEGLEFVDFIRVVEAEGARALVHDVLTKPAVDPYEFAYLLVESGIPALVVFAHAEQQAPKKAPKIAHIMPVVGHTLNGDKWLPVASMHYPSMRTDAGIDEHRYRSTAEWVCHLVIHDDYLGPYYCMTEEDLRYPRNTPEDKPKSRIQYVLGIVPKESVVTVAPYYIQDTAAKIFESCWEDLLGDIRGEWRSYFEKNPWVPDTLVLRTQLVGLEDYLGHLMSKSDHLGKQVLRNARKKLRSVLPENFWITEFTLPEVYAVNQASFGEVIIDASATELDLQNAFHEDSAVCLGIRFIDQFIPVAGKNIALGLTSHYPMFRRKGASPRFNEVTEPAN